MSNNENYVAVVVAMTNWISHTTTKRLRYEVSKIGGHAPPTFDCPNLKL